MWHHLIINRELYWFISTDRNKNKNNRCYVWWNMYFGLTMDLYLNKITNYFSSLVVASDMVLFWNKSWIEQTGVGFHRKDANGWISSQKFQRVNDLDSDFLLLHIISVNSCLFNFPSLSLSFRSKTASIWKKRKEKRCKDQIQFG